MKASLRNKGTAWALLFVSTVFGIYSFYWLAFSIWMTAHPLYDSPAWEHRVYIRFAVTVVDALIWLGSVIWLFHLASLDGKSKQNSNSLNGGPQRIR